MKKIETSKKITWLVLSFWILVTLATIVIYYFTDKNISFVLDYVQVPNTIIISSYFLKAGTENFAKIKFSNLDKSTTDNIITDATGSDIV